MSESSRKGLKRPAHSSLPKRRSRQRKEKIDIIEEKECDALSECEGHPTLVEQLKTTDSWFAFQYLRSKFEPFFTRVEASQKKKKAMLDHHVPVVLIHQIYTVVEDRTIVDKTIEQLSIAGILRRIKIGSKEGDVAVLLEEDFIHLLQQAVNYLESKYEDQPHSSAYDTIDTLKSYLSFIVNFHGLSITESSLIANLSNNELDMGVPPSIYLRPLTSCGMIIPRVNQITPSNQVEYWITLPYGGNLLANIQKGRKEMLSKFKRAKWNEIKEQALLTKNMRRSALGPLFHIKDLLGLNHLERIDTTSGYLLRLIGESQ